MAKIAVDIDDTLYSFSHLARKIMARLAKEQDDNLLLAVAYAHWPEWRTPPDLLGMDRWLEIVNMCHDLDTILEQEPYDGSAELLTELAEHHELVYVSNRKEKTFDATTLWLTKHNYPEGKLITAGHQSKNLLLGDCQYLIDDRPKTLVEFVTDYNWTNLHGTKGKKRVGFGMMTEFNRGLTDVPGIYLAPPGNWDLLRHYFVKTGVIPQPCLI